MDLFFLNIQLYAIRIRQRFLRKVFKSRSSSWLVTENLLTVEMILTIQYLHSHRSWITWLSNYFSCSVVQVADR